MSRKSRKTRNKPASGPTPIKENLSHPEPVKKSTTFQQTAIALLGALACAVLAPVANTGYHCWQRWYFRPRLELWYSNAEVLFAGAATETSTYNYVILLDRNKSCRVGTFAVTGPSAKMRKWDSYYQDVTSLLIQNSGRSSITGLRFALVGEHANELEVDAAPNLSIAKTLSKSSSYLDQLTISIHSLPPGSFGTLTFKQVVTRTPLQISQASDAKTIHYVMSPQSDQKLIFLGANETNSENFTPLPIWEMSSYESSLYGEDSPSLPSVTLPTFLDRKDNLEMTYNNTGSDLCDRSRSPSELKWHFEFPRRASGPT